MTSDDKEQVHGLLVLGDSIVRNVGDDHPDMKIGAEQLQRVIKKRNFVAPDTLIIHVGTNDIKNARNLDYVLGDIYDLTNTVKTKF